MTEPSPSTPDVPQDRPSATEPAPPAGDDVLAGGEPEQIQEAIRASQQRLSEAVDDVATAVNPKNVAQRSADAVREDPRPVLTVAAVVVGLVILLKLIQRVRRRGGADLG